MFVLFHIGMLSKAKLSISSLPHLSIALQLSVGCIIHSVLNEETSLALKLAEISRERRKERRLKEHFADG